MGLGLSPLARAQCWACTTKAKSPKNNYLSSPTRPDTLKALKPISNIVGNWAGTPSFHKPDKQLFQILPWSSRIQWRFLLWSYPLRWTWRELGELEKKSKAEWWQARIVIKAIFSEEIFLLNTFRRQVFLTSVDQYWSKVCVVIFEIEIVNFQMIK